MIFMPRTARNKTKWSYFLRKKKNKNKKSDFYKSASDPVIGLVGPDTMGTRTAACLCGSIPVGPPVVSRPYWEGASFLWLVPYFSSVPAHFRGWRVVNLAQSVKSRVIARAG